MLLDTCAFIWFLEDSAELSPEAKTAIENGEIVYLSIVSLWEIAIVTHDTKITKYNIPVIW